MSTEKQNTINDAFAKVPEVTIIFWIIKIFATTLGETAGDAVTMGDSSEGASKGLGYLAGMAIFLVPFIALVAWQIRARKFHPVLYWVTIIATTTLGTTIADFLDRSEHLHYTGGSSILFVCVIGSLLTWRLVMGSISINTVDSPKTEAFYWVTIMFSQTLGTALGDWVAADKDDGGLGLEYLGGAAVFGGLLAVVAALYFWTKIPRTLLFWAAFILTRPLGATVGDFLDKPHSDGGLALSRYAASGTLVALIVLCIFVFPHRAAKKAH
ncbi:MAG TPA: hypothetical protein VG733_15660 [Chthoniobacteraceae bacterium]|nr:hypothetical protein [Chthoniobacteraceae bacterium]